MSYGIGRVPADVDPASEALAVHEAAEMMAAASRVPRKASPPSVEWGEGVRKEALNWRPFLTARDGPKTCARCAEPIGCLTTTPGEGQREACYTNYGAALCAGCGAALTADRDAKALAYLLARPDELQAEAVAMHLRGNDYQLGQHHWRWLVGSSALKIILAAKLDAPSWWGDWRDDEGPLALLAQRVSAGEMLTPPRPRELCRCRRCGAAGMEGAYPFTTLPGSGLCDDCV